MKVTIPSASATPIDSTALDAVIVALGEATHPTDKILAFRAAMRGVILLMKQATARVEAIAKAAE